MPDFSTPAIMLRRIPYGDHARILTLLTPDHGKISVFARSARKDCRRFSGALEPFRILHAVIGDGRGRLAVLKEARTSDPLEALRSDFRSAALASYWCELVLSGTEEGAPQPDGYRLLHGALTALDRRHMAPAALNILFQLHFARLSGFFPALTRCRSCGVALDAAPDAVAVDIASGAMVCGRCFSGYGTHPLHSLSKGAMKALLWLAAADIQTAGRIRLNPGTRDACTRFLEAFIPYHLGRRPRSLDFLTHIRSRKREEGRICHVG
jgi:DNA repair protein RecO (recombination protein O)